MQTSTLHSLPPTSLYCIELPKETYRYFFDEEYFPGKLVTFVNEGEEEIKEYPLPEGNWQILGTMPSSTELSFDTSPYLESSEDDIGGGMSSIITYFDYVNDDKDQFPPFGFTNPIESLLSLLSSHNLHWTNPIEKPSILNHDIWHSEQDWKSYEDKLIKGQLLFLIKTK